MSQSKQMTVGSLLTALTNFYSDEPVCFDFAGLAPCELSSYRGRYADLAFATTDDRRTAGQLHRQLRLAIDNCYQGWKGGDYYADQDTLLWVAEPGVASGTAVVDLKRDPHTHQLTLYTAQSHEIDCDAKESAPTLERKVALYEYDGSVFKVTRIGYGILEVQMMGAEDKGDEGDESVARIITADPRPGSHCIALIDPGRPSEREIRPIPWYDPVDKVLHEACNWLAFHAEFPREADRLLHEERMPDRMDLLFERLVEGERLARPESSAEYLFYNGQMAPKR